MAQYGFEGDIENIAEPQLKFINSVILELGLENRKVFFEPVGLAGDNYVASVKRITIDGANRSLKLIAKIAPTLEAIRQAMNTDIMFINEHTMYLEVLPKLVQLQKDAKIPETEQLRYAKCYGSFTEQPNEVILLEDLKVSNFTTLDRFSPLSNDCVRSVLKNFAILHSLSFVLKYKEPDIYSEFKAKLIDVWGFMEKLEELKFYFQALETDTISLLEDQKHVDFVQGKVINAMDRAMELAKIDEVSKYTVIQQGDPWTNNIMFRIEEGKNIDSVMIDYQISKNTSPACDLMYMIFNCTDHEARSANFYDWIDYYHSEVEKCLSFFDLNVDLVYPRDKLDEDLKAYSQFLFGLCILLASVLIRKTDDAAKMKDAMNTENVLEQAQELLVSTLDEESITRFRKRIIGLIESFTQFGLL